MWNSGYSHPGAILLVRPASSRHSPLDRLDCSRQATANADDPSVIDHHANHSRRRGIIGLELARILPDYTPNVRLVGRHPKKVIPSNEVFAADLLQPADVMRAVEGAEVAYLVAGLSYNSKLWREQWPVLMRNTIAACQAHGCQLVFFDNIYLVDHDYLCPMDENKPVRPTSQKGAVRAEVARMLMQAVETGEVDALIARSADFYEPGKQPTSVLTQTVFERLTIGKFAHVYVAGRARLTPIEWQRRSVKQRCQYICNS